MSERAAHTPSTTAARSTRRTALALLCLLLSLCASVMLVVGHLDAVMLPGCGPHSGCAALAAGAWGELFGWPVSFIGVSYFLGLTAAWLLAQKTGLSPAARWLVRLGAAGSIAFTARMIYEGHLCLYCLLVHAGHLAFWTVLETTPVIRRRTVRPFVGFTAGAAAAGFVLGLLLARADQANADRAEEALRNSIAEMTAAHQSQAPDAASRHGFTGRHRIGPEAAALRLVVFTDFQCADCAELERQLAGLIPQFESISLSARHFPLCAACNPSVQYEWLHADACRAACVAEAAAELGGTDRFWRMRRWLFEQQGEFTDEQLRGALPELGFDDAARFLQTVDSEDVHSRVAGDVQEGIALGLTGTPAIFINGVELRGWDADDALSRALSALAAENLPALSPSADRPAARLDRLIELWRESDRNRFLPDQPSRRSLGPPDAAVRIVWFHDYRNPYSPQLSRTLLESVRSTPDVRLDLYLFPLSKARNPVLSRMEEERYPQSAETALLAEAVGHLGGVEAFWRMHAWLLESRDAYTRERGLAFAEQLGVDSAAVEERLATVSIRQAIGPEMAAAVKADVAWAPRVFLAGRRLPTPEPSAELLARLIEAARAEADRGQTDR